MNPHVNIAPDLTITVRRVIFFVLTLSTALLMLFLVHQTLAATIPLVIRITILGLFALTLPWMVVGFWNAIIGLLICQCVKDPIAIILPKNMQVSDTSPITHSTAILLCIRNESPARLIRNLQVMLEGIVQDQLGSFFHVYILSDTNEAIIAEEERVSFEEMRAQWSEQIQITYRRREDNTGFKAGNIADFCERWGKDHDFALVLDADSFMASSAITRLVLMMQANPRLGILQGLVIGLPSTSAFTRLFQYGMRLGMRSYTMGSAWWQADCGPYWGHNALIRLSPFMEFCDLPVLKNRSGVPYSILSHDLIEAILMRRAGYEVRIYPQEDLSWEENPPTLTEYIRRDLRWCEGNLQYRNLLTLPNLRPVSRYQLLLAIAMFLGSPAWIFLIIFCTIAIGLSMNPATLVNIDYFSTLLLVTLVMWYLPKITGAIDVLLRTSKSKLFGGRWRFLINLVLEMIFSLLMTPITWLNHTIFIFSLAFGKKGGWSAQTRDDHSISITHALLQFWPHTILGLALTSMLYYTHPEALPYAMLFFGGLLFSIPLVVITSQPWLGRFMIRHRLLSLPEEIMPAKELLPLQLSALQDSAKTPHNI
ncbi:MULTISPECIES: glucans biosynthesis glucosyltransferase MdoH [unclassified Polynucleobacter]|uniref:glucans biosynthesis glucosyltransferase MdoH n=1 Tax=unclassified Polynucleobacter TaxID=2640945 RepID=UPI0024918703|nr:MULTISPECIES: glucans biosynthesis glucosyltransferase MdoH [unclassified Polynucleobacter]